MNPSKSREGLLMQGRFNERLGKTGSPSWIEYGFQGLSQLIWMADAGLYLARMFYVFLEGALNGSANALGRSMIGFGPDQGGRSLAHMLAQALNQFANIPAGIATLFTTEAFAVGEDQEGVGPLRQLRCVRGRRDLQAAGLRPRQRTEQHQREQPDGGRERQRRLAGERRGAHAASEAVS